MKLVLATPLYPPELGGPATYAKLLVEHLPEIESSQNDEITLVKFAVVRHLPSGVRHLAYFWHVLRAAQRADIVLALDPVSTGLPALLAAQVAGKPFVVKIVGDYAWEQGKQRSGITALLDDFVQQRNVPMLVKLLRALQTYVARSAISIIVPSEYLKKIVSTWDASLTEKIIVINNAIEREDPTDVPTRVSDLARPRIVSAGRLVPWKGFDGVMKAVVDVRKQVPSASLVLIGDGPDRSMLESRALHTLKDGYVFTGALSHAEALATIADADVFVLNSTYEGMSHFLIEALVSGVAIVATAVGGNGEVITDNEDGLLVPSGDTDRLAETITRILQDDELRARLCARAAQSATRFSVPVMIKATRNHLASLLTP